MTAALEQAAAVGQRATLRRQAVQAGNLVALPDTMGHRFDVTAEWLCRALDAGLVTEPEPSDVSNIVVHHRDSGAQLYQLRDTDLVGLRLFYFRARP